MVRVGTTALSKVGLCLLMTCFITKMPPNLSHSETPQPPFLLCQNSRISSIKITVVVCQIYNKLCLLHSVVIESAFSGKTELSTNFDILFSKDSDPKKNKIENFYEKSKQSYVFSLEYCYSIAQKIFDCILLNFYYLFFI